MSSSGHLGSSSDRTKIPRRALRYNGIWAESQSHCPLGAHVFPLEPLGQSLPLPGDQGQTKAPFKGTWWLQVLLSHRDSSIAWIFAVVC